MKTKNSNKKMFLKNLGIAALLFFGLTFVSCKKDRTCECSSTSLNTNYNSYNNTTTTSTQSGTSTQKYHKVTKKYANQTCLSSVSSSNSDYGSSMYRTD